MPDWSDISTQISSTTGRPFTVNAAHAIGGGCINQAFQIIDDTEQYFVKLNHADKYTMFEAEAEGLNEIYQSNSLCVPQPICLGQNQFMAWLVLEYIPFGGTSGNDAALGAGLAAMHRVSNVQFGWYRDNTIGETLQINTLSPSWVDFWRTHRLGFQLHLAAQNGHHGKLQKRGEQLMLDLDHFFSGVTLQPSLLHGDLWSGNYQFDRSGNPVIFDPAVYYGDREADLAMTELFGGFSRNFYSAYRHEYPLDSGYNIRKVLYNLYHILNHLNLFGGGYLSQAEQMIEKLITEVR